MSGGALVFMVLAWGIIIATIAVSLSALLKHSKN